MTMSKCIDIRTGEKIYAYYKRKQVFYFGNWYKNNLRRMAENNDGS